MCRSAAVPIWLCLMAGLQKQLTAAQGNGFALAPTPPTEAPSNTAPGACGDERYRLTLCFPGSPQNATCRYNLEANATSDEIRPHSPQKDCPQDFLFGQPCTEMIGTIYFAFGPCNSDDVPAEQRADNTKDVTGWINTLGLRTAAVTFSGLATPALPEISSIPGGLSILDSPDADFSSPQRFLSLTNVTNGMSIAGCSNLKSLKGLEGLVGEDTVSNVLIIYNPILEDVSALSGLFKCQPGGSTLMNPTAIVGTIAVHPPDLQPLNRGCTLSTPATICSFIADSSQCPAGTEGLADQHRSRADLVGAPTPQ